MAARVTRRIEPMLSDMTSPQNSSSASAVGFFPTRLPALLIRMSIPPRNVAASATIRSQSGVSVRSPAADASRRPAPLASFSSALAPSALVL